MKNIVLDTNCLIATLPAKSKYHKLWNSILSGKINLCVSNEILNEYEEIIARKTNAHFASNIIYLLLNLNNVILYDPWYNFHLIDQDEDDNKFVDCAIAAQAECIVSEDSHFRVLKFIDFPKVTLLRLDEFMKKYETDIKN